ncbi:hypothetical protein SPD48_12090 [Pseudogracilibacillus sp. SE30717A]|uniref:hypothetical protein n=1 Tax=Pseudogracilibacillus sp. SE30717A TaxID=3098293 RepID=UPI00300DE864
MIKIGIIGPTWIETRIKQCIKRFPNFNPIFKTSNNIYDAITFTNELGDSCDVLLYSGYIPYYISKKARVHTVPAHYIPVKGASLYRAFYRLQKRLHSIKTVSIDTLERADFKTLNQDLDENINSVHYQEKVTLAETEKIVEFHKSNFQNQRVDCALTGLKVVSDRLNELSVPNEWILPTDGDIIVTLERALLATEKRKKLESQIVFGIIYIANFESLKKEAINEQTIQRLNLEIQNIILDFIDLLEGHLTSLGGNEYMFITTRGTFERVTQGYKYFPLFDNKKQNKIKMSAGVGFGVTASEAGSHARMALLQANEYGEGNCFIVKEDRAVIGPIENDIPLTYPLTITDENIIKRAEKSSVSPFYIKKVISLLQRKNTNTFTAHELAATLGITPRSANRLIVNWLDAKLIEVTGLEKVQKRGRPRQVYALKK